MKNLLKYCATAVLFVFMVSGCGAPSSGLPSDGPQQVMEGYYQSLVDGKYSDAYEMLDNAAKNYFSKDDFILRMSLYKEVYILKSWKVEKTNEYKDKDIDGTKYKDAVEYNTTEFFQDIYNNKEGSGTAKKMVVNENGAWKFHRDKVNIKQEIAAIYHAIAVMYIDGKGRAKDSNEAIVQLKKGIDICKDYVPQYYPLAVAYFQSGKFDESIENAQIFLDKSNENTQKAFGYNVLGMSYNGKGDTAKAREYLNKAVELDPNNEYAKNNLNELNK